MEKQSEVSTEKVLKNAARKTAEAASLLGVTFLAHPEREVYICRISERDPDIGFGESFAVYPARRGEAR